VVVRQCAARVARSAYSGAVNSEAAANALRAPLARAVYAPCARCGAPPRAINRLHYFYCLPPLMFAATPAGFFALFFTPALTHHAIACLPLRCYYYCDADTLIRARQYAIRGDAFTMP